MLIVDDSHDDALLIQRLLEAKKSYRVFRADNGIGGLALARQRRPDLIIIDLMMPGLDGFSLLQELRRDKRTAQIPVIVVSAKDITIEERNRLKGHIEALYQKGSLSPRAFVEQVVQVLGEKPPREGIS